MAMFECPLCSKECSMLVIPPDGKLSCRTCAGNRPKRYNVNLGQTSDKWTHIDKKGNEHKHRLTVGKEWEIERRRLAEDGVTVINKATGRETEY